MGNVKKNIFTFFLFHVLAIPSFAGNLYVDQKNTSGGNGSKANPFKSISEALSAANENDVIKVANGIYREKLTFLKNYISVVAIGDGVYVTGTDLITDWVNEHSGIYKAKIASEAHSLFLNSVPQTNARHPNKAPGSSFFDFASIAVSFEKTGDKLGVLTLPSGHPVNSKWINGTVWMLLDGRWVAQTGKISSYSGDKLSIENVSADYDQNGIAYITNTLEALDAIGEWHWDGDSIHYYFGSVGNISTTRVEVQVRETVIEMSGTTGITIEGIKTYGGNVRMNNTKSALLKKCQFLYLNEYHFIPANQHTYSRGEWLNIDKHGIGIGIFGSDNVVEECEIAYSSGDGVTLYGQNNTLKNCVIHDANLLTADMSPVSIGGTGNRVEHCNIYNAGRDVINFNFAKAFKIKYNNIYGGGKIAWDLGGIYGYNNDCAGAEIAYNWVHDIQSGNPETFWGASGIYMDNNSRNAKIHHNVIWNCKGAGIQLNMPANGYQVYNNTSFACEKMGTYLHPNYKDLPSGNCSFINNYINGELLNQPWLALANNVSTTSDDLTNRSQLNFTPKAGSPLIDAGIQVDPSIGFYGNSPDIGAYESMGTNWGVGPFSLENGQDIVTTTLHKKVTDLIIFPNPTYDSISLNLDAYSYYKIYSITGQLVKEGKLLNKTINLQDVVPGKYLVMVFNDLDSATFQITKL